MSKNLFDYATRELSQDAFLRWILENFDDPIVGVATKKLIKKMADLYTNQKFDVSKISEVKTYAQYKHMDIVADVYSEGKKYTFVIEDKTTSSEHSNQLLHYNDYIDSWDDQEFKYRIFYKTDYIEKDELERVDKAGWKLFDIKTIYEVFSEFHNSNNDVLSYYSEYCKGKYDQVNSVSSKALREWNFEEWHTWFRKELIPTFNREFNNQIEVYVWKYQGRYISIGVYFCKYINDKNKPLIEFFFRNGDVITATMHTETKGVKDSWSRDNITDSFKQSFDSFYSKGELPSFKKLNTKHCIAKMKDPILKDSCENVLNSLLERTREFNEFFLKF